ncbi:hypothetical protein BDP27DRAFT_1075606 [Rhodocollybia butyracea]|uniref:Uncharacterized protein n=1 Tax=Rhodocollybia butyracea TaxID=206335 RepID=A0A9P5U3J0_9AGAR|nr:hypothetical protein BDP27DRAFT_1075606 [Rhodocollybia butyracea]
MKAQDYRTFNLRFQVAKCPPWMQYHQLNLIEPISFGSWLTLHNRVFISALTRNCSVPTNVPNDLNVEYSRQHPRSAKLIVSEEAALTLRMDSLGRTTRPHAPGI